MRRLLITALPVLVALGGGLAGCGGDETTLPKPVERPVPPAAAKPSVQVVSATAPLTRRIVADGFSRPSALIQEPGPAGRTLVIEQWGTARWLTDAGPAPGPAFLDLRSIVRFHGEQGLLGLAFLPGYRTDPRVAVHYIDIEGNTRVVIYRIRNGAVDPLRPDEILFVEQPYANHNGGALAIGPDHQLYLGLGDGGSAYDPRENGQDLQSRLGKVLRYDLSVKRPAPVQPVNDDGELPSPTDLAEAAKQNAVAVAARWQVVAYGLRDPWRLAFAPRSGDLWIADAGRDLAQRQTQEINRIPASNVRDAAPPANFGWAAYDGVRDQVNRDITLTGALSWPQASFVPKGGCAVTGGVVVERTGSVAKTLGGRYVFGDYCSGRIWTVPASGAIDGEMRTEGVRVPNQTAYVQDARGRLLVSSAGGKVFELVGPKSAKPGERKSAARKR